MGSQDQEATEQLSTQSDSKGFLGGGSGKEATCSAGDIELWVWSLGQEDALEEGMATRSSILAWRIPWTEEPNRFWSIGSQKSQTKLKQLSTLRRGNIKYVLSLQRQHMILLLQNPCLILILLTFRIWNHFFICLFLRLDCEFIEGRDHVLLIYLFQPTSIKNARLSKEKYSLLEAN